MGIKFKRNNKYTYICKYKYNYKYIYKYIYTNEEGAELEKAQVNSTAKRFWNEALAKEETQSNLKTNSKTNKKTKKPQFRLREGVKKKS